MLRYLSAYPTHLQQQIQQLLDERRLADMLLKRYPSPHTIRSNRALYDFVLDLKARFLKKSDPLSKVEFDPKIHVINHALGTHRYVSRIQGNKLKAKNEIRISTLFKSVPEDFLTMIAVHELAHLKEKEHNKAFYQLCTYMMPEYHQVEFDLRVYLTLLEVEGDIYG